MNRFQKIMMIVIAILLVLILSFDAALFNAIKFEPNKLTVRYETLKDENIPLSMNDVSILYFTDLQYGQYENKDRSDRLFNEIEELHPDILIFGGDLFDEDTEINAKTKSYITKKLSKIDAPLGKFAVIGEKDIQDNNRKDTIKKIYKKAQIEILNDTNVSLTNHSSSHIKLIGLSNQADISKATKNLSSDSYNLLVSHKPDALTSSQLSTAGITLALAGHSHGTQVTYPLLGPYKNTSGATKLNRSKSEDLEFDYMISSGVGCTNVDVRFNARPEIHYFILKHK